MTNAKSNMTKIRDAGTVKSAADVVKRTLESHEVLPDIQYDAALERQCKKVIKAYENISDVTLPYAKEIVTKAYTSLCDTHDKLKNEEGYTEFLKAKGIDQVMEQFVQPESKSEERPPSPGRGQAG
jgi:ribosomal protein L7/L12